MADQILVTGGAGYVGSLAVGHLLARGHRVRILDSLIHGGVPSLLSVWGSSGLEFVRGDVCDGQAVRQALRDTHCVVHLAGIVGDPACARSPELAREVNFEATTRLLSAARDAGVERFIFLSTCSNYGKLVDGDGYATEDWALNPVSLYAETKVAAELEVLGAATPDFTTCCLRLATVYGASPRMRFDLTVNEFTRDVVLQKPLVVYGEQFWRPYVHVRDASRSICEAVGAASADVSGEVFNVGNTAENYRKLDLVSLLTERVPDANVEFVHKDEDPRDYRVSFEKIREGLGFETEHTVPSGMDELAILLRSGMFDDPYAPIYRN